ncbi:MAG: hypothetical protein R3F54_21300 [Alphaproteobacteria bacterium]
MNRVKNNTWAIANNIDKRIPYKPSNNLIQNKVILFPSKPEGYRSEAELLDEVRFYIHRYVNVSPEFERIAATYVLLTWLYDRFDELPYLRVRGDYGTGKTRFLLIVGSICYKPIFASGASTISPLFHLLDTFKGTLIIDEADFRLSDEKADVVKILNNGNVRGMPILRTRQTREGEYDPRAFQVFGPKLLATRGQYQDRALESRFISEAMGTRSLRKDVPITLPARQRQEALSLRNKLLMFRFHNYHRKQTKPHLFDEAVEPRIRQIFVSLISITDDLELQHELSELATAFSEQIKADRGMQIEARLLEAIRNSDLSVKSITEIFAKRHGTEYQAVTYRWIGGLIRRKLQINTHKSNGVYIIPNEEIPKLEALYQRYGIERPDITFEPLDN